MIGLDFSAVFDCVNQKAYMFKLKYLGIGGPFLSTLMEFSTEYRGLFLMVTIVSGEKLSQVCLKGVFSGPYF